MPGYGLAFFIMTTRTELPLALTMGDAAGIGPEIIVKLFDGLLTYPAVVYGDAGVLQKTIKQLNLENRLRVQTSNTPHALGAGIIPVLSRKPPLPPIQLGLAQAAAGKGSYEYLCHAIDDAKKGLTRAIVTAPLNKHAMQLAGIDAPGHTEILAERTHTEHYAMMLVNRDLRVILVTIHEPLARVPQLITQEKELQIIQLAHQACQHAGIQAPRIAVAGLNPHAGEDGKFGTEDQRIIQPAIAQAQQQGIEVSGPWPGDTIFMRARKGEFDIVVAQYHDQGLIPIKYLGLDEGVNVTVGLPFIRTSVDHGTAFDIAGQNRADPSSLLSACQLALEMSQQQTPTTHIGE